MPEYKFEAILKEKSEISICIEAGSEEEARKMIEQRDFSWPDQVKHYSYVISDIERIRLVTTKEAA